MKGSLIQSLKPVFFTLCLLALGAASAQASAIYKSVDERGNVQFTQKPPASGEYEVMQGGTTTRSVSADEKAEPEPVEDESTANDQPDEILAFDREKAEQICQQAREELAAMQDESHQVVRRGEAGELEPLSAEQRAERIEELNTVIDQACFD